MASLLDPNKGTWVFLCFLGFFGIVVAVNAIYITEALDSFSGVITDKPYEKGLAYDEVLNEAKNQSPLLKKPYFKDGTLFWEILEESGTVDDAIVTAKLVRPVQDGYDFEIELKQTQKGHYQAPLNLPLKGLWKAQLLATWNNNQSQHQATLSIIAK